MRRVVTGNKEAPARRQRWRLKPERRGILVALGGLGLWEKAGRRRNGITATLAGRTSKFSDG
jgi:hypothetical protein